MRRRVKTRSLGSVKRGGFNCGGKGFLGERPGRERRARGREGGFWAFVRLVRFRRGWGCTRRGRWRDWRDSLRRQLQVFESVSCQLRCFFFMFHFCFEMGMFRGSEGGRGCCWSWKGRRIATQCVQLLVALLGGERPVAKRWMHGESEEWWCRKGSLVL